MLELTRLRAIASRYVAAGFAVFPVARDCRVPLHDGGCHAATVDPDRVPHLFDRPANIALACGPRSGVFVLDVDVKSEVDGFDSLRRLEEDYGAKLPSSWTVQTPSGGQHRYFRQPADRALRNRVNLTAERADGCKVKYHGLDVRTGGGSVCLPPSLRADGAYRWVLSPKSVVLADAPGWLLEIIDPPAPPRLERPVTIDGVDRAAQYVARVVNDDCGELARMGPNSGRNARLFQVAARLGELVGGGLLPEQSAREVLERAATENGLVREDGIRAVRATIISGLKRGVANPQDLEVRH